MSEADRQRWNDRYATRPSPLDDRPDTLLVRFRHLLTGGQALDLACGVGQNALWLAGQGYRVDAVDISDVAIGWLRAEAARRGLPVRAIQADLDDYRLPAGTYDLVVVFYFLDRRLAPQLVAALRPGGLLFYETLNVRRLIDKPETERAYLLEIGELGRLFAGLAVLWDSDTAGGTGITSSLVARK
jgi:2-polyprenyl-3-methyl-5-hydroxy-6-metoxy-1,4-benzoquinol methylase